MRLSNTHFKIYMMLFLITLAIISTSGQKLKYLNGILEDEACKMENGTNGTCRKISECINQFQTYKENQGTLTVCNYGEAPLNDTICCPNNQFNQEFNKLIQKPDILDFNVCRNEFLKYRNFAIYVGHLAKAMEEGKIPTNKKNCDYLNMVSFLEQTKNPLDPNFYKCNLYNGKYKVDIFAPSLYGTLVERGHRPNMAAIGWTQDNGLVEYKCGGSIITERFIVTAAHCKFFKGKEPDTVRLGDRFLITKEDDDIAQQLRIEKLIIHPDYTSKYHYNDIAMIKTSHEIIYNKFVVPSCIDDLDSERKGYFTDWTVAGYGETEYGVQSNVLLELKVELTSYEECNKIYESIPSLPNGILPSQFCVKSRQIGENMYPDTCFGDSGSPLQFKTVHEVFAEDFNTNYLSTIYHTSTVLGIVSFGIHCGLDAPSVYTKLVYYKDWMRNVINNS